MDYHKDVGLRQAKYFFVVCALLGLNVLVHFKKHNIKSLLSILCDLSMKSVL